MLFLYFLFMVLTINPVWAEPPTGEIFLQPSSFNEQEVIVKRLDAAGHVIPEKEEPVAQPVLTKRMKKVEVYKAPEIASFDDALKESPESASTFSTLEKADIVPETSTFSSMQDVRDAVKEANSTLVECKDNEAGCEKYIVDTKGTVLTPVSTFGG